MITLESKRKPSLNLIIFFDGSENTIRELERKYGFLFPVYDNESKQKEKGKMILRYGINVITIMTGDFICLSDYSVQILKRTQLENEFKLTKKQLNAISFEVNEAENN